MKNRRHFSSHKIVCWQLSRFCNRRCNFCISGSDPSQSHPVRNTNRSLVRLRELGVEKISISGGEPLLYPYLQETVRVANELGFKIILTTNGDCFKNIPDYLSVLEYIKLSFYGGVFVHDKIMGAGHYRKLMKVVRRLTEKGISVGVNYLLCDATLKDLEEFLSAAARENIQNVLLQTYMKTVKSGVDAGLRIGPDVVEKAHEIARAYVEYFPGGLKLHDYSNPGFYIVVDTNDCITIPQPREREAWIAGSIFDELGFLPDGKQKPVQEILEYVWGRRFVTKAIVAI